MNIEEKLAESNELLMDTSLSGLTVAIDGLIWKPQFAEYLCKHHGLDVYKVTFNRATCARWYWWKYWSKNRSTVTRLLWLRKTGRIMVTLPGGHVAYCVICIRRETTNSKERSLGTAIR